MSVTPETLRDYKSTFLLIWLQDLVIRMVINSTAEESEF